MPHRSEDYKETAVRHYLEQSHNRAETCRIFDCENKTLGRWVERYREEGELKRHNRQPRAYKMKQSYVKEALRYLGEDKTVSTPKLHAHLVATFPEFDITEQHLGKVIRDNNLTRKRTKHGHYPKTRFRNPVDRNEDLKEFYEITSAHPIDKIVSVDETSITPFMFRPYSRCGLGDKCIETTDNNKVFTKHTFVAAITNRRCLGWATYEEGAMNQERFVDFIRTLITKKKLKGYLFLFDNAGAHKGQALRDLIEDSDNEMCYMIPYNPQTNVIEIWFSQFKHYMRDSRTRTYQELNAACRTVIAKIKPEHYKNYFDYAYRKYEYPQRPRPCELTRKRPPKNYKVGGGEST